MRQLIFFICLFGGFVSCKKDKFTTAPQIKFESVIPNTASTDLGSPIPDITFNITDKEGDIGFNNGSDTAFIYLKNNLTGKSDSVAFPDLLSAGKSNFKADVNVSINSVLDCKSLPGLPLHTDTLYFDVYVKDFKKNKSNVITTADPVFYRCR